MQETGRLRAVFLMIDGKPVAARLGLIHRGTWIDFQAGRDPAFTGHEVSYITLWHCAERAIGEGLTRMDSLDEYEYKRRYFRETRWLADLRLYDDRPSSAAREIWRTAKGSARHTLRGLVPAKLRARLRR
jgi:CelD/BcsL family acetyltransferase involved in cellulose biosynthesis